MLRRHLLQALAMKVLAAKVVPRRRLPKTGGAFGNPRWMREAGVTPFGISEGRGEL